MKRKYKILGITVFLILYIAVLFLGAVIKVPSEVVSVKGMDKLIHFAEYFFLALVLFKSLELYKVKSRNIYIIGIVVGILFMVLSEMVQLLLPDRTFSYYDLLADLAGFIVGMGVFKWMFFKR